MENRLLKKNPTASFDIFSSLLICLLNFTSEVSIFLVFSFLYCFTDKHRLNLGPMAREKKLLKRLRIRFLLSLLYSTVQMKKNVGFHDFGIVRFTFI